MKGLCTGSLWRLAALIGALWLFAASASFAESLDARGFSAQRQVESTREDTLSPLQERLEESQEREPLSGEEAASELDDTAKKAPNLSSGIAAKLPSLDNLTKLKAQMQAQPSNLDIAFAHAQMATQLGEYAQAGETYEQMLRLAPTLDRVRLDLGTIYLRLGRFEEAREQLRLVQNKEGIPEAVRANIERVLAKIDGELSEHDLTYLLSAGINWDTNANSAPRGGEVLVFDTSIALSDEQLAQRDMQGFYVLGVNHTYRPQALQDDRFARRWKSAVNWYQSEQSTQDALNVKVLSLRSGPEFQSKSSGITLAPAINHSIITLDGHTYLRSSALENRLDIPLSPAWLLSGNAKMEWRNFVNSPSVSAFDLRDGTASQSGLSLRYLASEKDIFNLGITHRREHTREEFFDNTQAGASLSYTRILPYDSFANLSLGYKHTLYEENDSLISERRRRDAEYSAGLTIGHQIAEGLSVSGGYQYRSVQSNIPNYDYDNHRFSASITRQF